LRAAAFSHAFSTVSESPIHKAHHRGLIVDSWCVRRGFERPVRERLTASAARGATGVGEWRRCEGAVAVGATVITCGSPAFYPHLCGSPAFYPHLSTN
jgi:hypothetical protein